jgi:cell wall-associated NlpC family hydrolase
MAWPARAAAQGILLDVGYVFRTSVPDLASYRAAFVMPFAGPIRWGLAGELLMDVGSSPIDRWGAGVDLTAWRGGRGPFAALSLDGGFETGGPDDTWASWSAGAGYDLHLAAGVTVGADARYRGFFGKEPGGVQLSAGVTYWWGRRKKAEAPETEKPTAEGPAVEGPTATGTATLEAGVVNSARQALGKPYLYGGTGQGDDGFDCSGLIQYAYAEQGIALPRVSTAQATQGRDVEKSIDALAPGDILTFAGQPGGSQVSHVGLYLGGGRYNHSSSSKGVMESTLSAGDPNGQWWYARWVGARRVIGE